MRAHPNERPSIRRDSGECPRGVPQASGDLGKRFLVSFQFIGQYLGFKLVVSMRQRQMDSVQLTLGTWQLVGAAPASQPIDIRAEAIDFFRENSFFVSLDCIGAKFAACVAIDRPCAADRQVQVDREEESHVPLRAPTHKSQGLRGVIFCEAIDDEARADGHQFFGKIRHFSGRDHLFNHHNFRKSLLDPGRIEVAETLQGMEGLGRDASPEVPEE